MRRFSAFGVVAPLFCCALALLILAGFGLSSLSSARAQDAQNANEAAPLEKLTLVTDAKGAHPVDHVLQVEVMRDDAGRERGLMFRRYMPADRGMLFDFGAEHGVLMWMKNTYIPLDMIFFSRAGVVTHIAENAEPLSEAIISSEGPVYGVLEVNAGYARKIGLKNGDIVRHPMFAH